MVVFGKVLYDRGKRDEALKWFRDARGLGQEFDGLAQALTSEGQILLDRNDRVGAEKLFRKAALELDDPVAYYVLSTLQLRGSPEEEIYLLKAASSGIVDACHRLGELEMEKTKMSQPKGTYAGAPVRDFKMAIEWWQVAAAAGHGRSMLSLATLYRAEGQDGQGLEWLELAEKQPELKNEARKVRAAWASLKPS
jgi:TPR repeat protein